MNVTVYGDLYLRIVVKYTFCDIFLPSAIIFPTVVQDILQQQLTTVCTSVLACWWPVKKENSRTVVPLLQNCND